MLARRTARLSAAALGQAFQAPGSFLVRVTANGQRDWTLSLRKGHTLQQRLFTVDVALVHLGKRPQPLDPHPIRSSPGFVITEWGHLNRASTLAENLPRSAQLAGGGHLHVRHPLDGVKRRHISRGQPAGSDSVRTTQIRASSTAAAPKKSEERTTDADKGDEQNAKEAPAAEKTPMEPEPEEGKPNKTQQLKKVFKEYGAVGVSFHIGISLMSLGMFYLLLSSGIDMTALLCRLGFSEAVVQSKMAAGTSTFVLAYAVHKLFAPVRISVTLVSVPLIVRYLRRTGLFKPPTPAP